ncbi:MAG TPA: DNA/RNA non-specific endonuclease [Candidatus Galloscillospira excrementavium]|nr:DNA/RNA non-specific endonuclease [Candidatus Galloscillospira excrementavium]
MKQRLSSLLLALLLALSLAGCELLAPAPSLLSGGSFDPDSLPAYSGEPYVEVNGNVPYFTEEDLTTDAFEEYSPLDALGRCGVAFANVCPALMPTEERGEIGMIRPSGWQTIRYDGVVDGNYLYNRCHLIGYQLSGENANEENLITGTRYLNVEGMLPFENLVDDYVDETGNHVLYRVTPVFTGENLLADGVLMEARSVEDEGRGVTFCVFCYNVQPGVVIDYATGESHLSGEEPEETPAGEANYILNTNTMKFHLPTCASVADIKPANRGTVATREEALAAGYEPCGRCNP